MTIALKELPLKGKKILVRVDFNVPLDKKGRITDDTRIVASLPTIRYILEQGGNPILMSHLGRPKGRQDLSMSLSVCARRLAEMLGKPVIMAPDCIGNQVEALINKLRPGESLLLENLRFHPGEENPTEHPEFVNALAKLGEIYVNDAFGTAHRKHASTYFIVPFFKGRAAPGFLLEKEIEFLGNEISKPKRPFFAVIGGAKISSKIGVIKALASKVDSLLIGGAMAFTFLKAKHVNIGDSLFETDCLDTAKAIMETYEKAGVRILFPVDHVIVTDIDQDQFPKIVDNQSGIPKGYKGVDIGPRTIEIYSSELANGKTIFWNGPMGIFEHQEFAKGTKAIAEAIAKVKGTKIVGGGDSVAAIRSLNLAHQFTHLSTGGGASLEYLEFGTLPGLEVLKNIP
ncbi:phosphoglycerate kinase [Waddlia chondrophila 2032/99]|uniref:Phosphoglycerate kinase n=2 Tax=Waddlia chondrophila TaxID=71667 RepID=D6YSJ9_WADCW|nr:phosphoglycerate kinase [Waddlia chondrophila]ADI39044.1 phosphoglycerate kinase [Waddlia chondrophila WSU 86-1044]CCB92156.1 phosphoglycerate kinase [Waddlia chondrophila 2032/99]